MLFDERKKRGRRYARARDAHPLPCSWCRGWGTVGEERTDGKPGTGEPCPRCGGAGANEPLRPVGTRFNLARDFRCVFEVSENAAELLTTMRVPVVRTSHPEPEEYIGDPGEVQLAPAVMGMVAEIVINDREPTPYIGNRGGAMLRRWARWEQEAIIKQVWRDSELQEYLHGLDRLDEQRDRNPTGRDPFEDRANAKAKAAVFGAIYGQHPDIDLSTVQVDYAQLEHRVASQLASPAHHTMVTASSATRALRKIRDSWPEHDRGRAFAGETARGNFIPPSRRMLVKSSTPGSDFVIAVDADCYEEHPDVRPYGPEKPKKLALSDLFSRKAKNLLTGG